MEATIAFALFVIVSAFLSPATALSPYYYDKSCPNVDAIVSNAVIEAMQKDRTVPAALLRMHFHDCFIRGCDASVLLDSEGSNKAEKDGPPNVSLHAFYVIDNAKKAVEQACPRTVSCSDILALAARDAVALSGGPTWEVPKGRKDGRISMAADTRQLPGPTFNITQLQQSFAQRGLDLGDLVALSGGHTLGFAHCSSFQNRIHSFNTSADVDPSMSPVFAARLRNLCPVHNQVKSAGSALDATAFAFDNVYFKMLLLGSSVLSSDQALLDDAVSRNLVFEFATSREAFDRAFVMSMIRMSSLTGGQEVRTNCRKVN